jgi:predicted DNA-binding antitoxin AbrB/MazE fold protein
MKAEVMAIVVNGILKPDTALPFAEQTKVKLIIEPVESENPSLTAWERLKERLRQRPVHGGGKRFTREELHERC